MHIERILLRDVGPFDDVTIELPKGTDPRLADVYLLTGPNGTGKSTILYALASVIGGRALDIDEIELGPESASNSYAFEDCPGRGHDRGQASLRSNGLDVSPHQRPS